MNLKPISIIPIRSKSKGIKNKNIKFLFKKRLVFYVVDEALKSKLFSSIILSTDSNEYINILSKKYTNNNEVVLHKRSIFSSTDNASTEIVLLEILKELKKYQNCFLIQATSPLLKNSDIKNAYKKFLKNNYDSLFSGYNFKKFLWKKMGNKNVPLNYKVKKRPMRQENKNFILENGAFYIFKIKKFLKYKVRLFQKIGSYEMPENRSIEIDTLEDFELTKFFLKNRIDV